MLIKTFTVKNFKSFGKSTNPRDNEIKSLGKINMLFGYNNSGKSNLLKCLHLIFYPKQLTEGLVVEGEKMEKSGGKTFWRGPIDKVPFIFHKNNRNVPIEFELSMKIFHDEIKKSGFSHYKALADMYLSKTHDYATLNLKGEIRKIDDFETAEIVLVEAKLNAKIIFSIDPTSKRNQYFATATNALKGDGATFASLLGMLDNSALLFDNNRYLVDEFMQHLNNGPDPFSASLSPTWFKNWLYQQYMNPRNKDVFHELGKFINKYRITHKSTDESSFKNVELFSPFKDFSPEFAVINGYLDIMFKVGKERLPIGSFGTGIQQILYILTTLFITKAKFVLIEEIELNLSPKYQNELFKILCALIEDKKIDQVFFTTHSKYFNFRNDFSIYEVSINANGCSKAKKVGARRVSTFFPATLH